MNNDKDIQNFIKNYKRTIETHENFIKNYNKTVDIAQKILNAHETVKQTFEDISRSNHMGPVTLPMAKEILNTLPVFDNPPPPIVDNPIPGYIEDMPIEVIEETPKAPNKNKLKLLGITGTALLLLAAALLLNARGQNRLARDAANADRYAYLTEALEDLRYEYNSLDIMNPARRELRANIANYQRELDRLTKQRQR